MKYSRRIVISITWIILGVVLSVLSFMNIIESFWSGFGGGILLVGILQVFRQIKYRTNEQYREKIDTAIDDERNKFIANKAWAWSGYIFVIVAAIGTIIFKLLDKEELMLLCSGSVCFFVIVYYIAYMILRRKY